MTKMELATLIIAADAGQEEALQAWLDTTPPADANDALYRLALATVYNTPTPNILLILLCLGVLPFLFVSALTALRHESFYSALLPMFMLGVSNAMAGRAVKRVCRQKRLGQARSALLLLAARGDRRALPLLASAWTHRPPLGRREWNDKISAALVALLDQDDMPPLEGYEQEKLRRVGEALLSPAFRAAPDDLTTSDAYLVIALLRCLHQAGGLWNEDFVERATRLTAAPTIPNLTLVHDTAALLLHTDASKTAAPPTMQEAAPAIQTLQRP